MKNTLVEKTRKTHKWLNRKKIQNRIPMVLTIIRTEATSEMTTTKYHLHHMITTKITTNYLTMIVEDHICKIASTPKRAVRAAQATTTKGITDKEHRSTMKLKDTKHQTHKPMDNQYRSIDQRHTNHTKRNENSE
jgi:hypothetical protein